MLKESGTGVQGHSRTPEENGRALAHIINYQQNGLSFDQAVKATAKAEMSSPTTLRRMTKEFVATGSLLPPHDRRTDPRHPFYRNCGPSPAVIELIHRELHDVALNNVFESCTTLCMELKEQLDIQVSKSTMHRWLHALGYQYGKKKFSNISVKAKLRNRACEGVKYKKIQEARSESTINYSVYGGVN
jgi:transposase